MWGNNWLPRCQRSCGAVWCKNNEATLFPGTYFGDRYRVYRNKRPPQNKRPPKTVILQRGEYTKPMGFDGRFFKGGSTQNRWALMGDFSKGGVHKTDGFGWVIFQRGEYMKPMGFGIFFLLLLRIKCPGRLFGKYDISLLVMIPLTFT